MKLRRFQLEWPSLDRQTGAARALAARTVVSLYQRVFVPLEASTTQKVIVECESENGPPSEEGGVATVGVVFDEAAYTRATSGQRNLLVLDALQRGLLRVAALRGWSQAPFQAAFEAVVSRGFKNEWQWPKRKVMSPDRRLRASVWCDHGNDRYLGTMIVETRNGDVVRSATIVDERPDEAFFWYLFGTLLWSDANHVELHDRWGTLVRSIDIRDGSVAWWVSPAEAEDDERSPGRD